MAEQDSRTMEAVLARLEVLEKHTARLARHNALLKGAVLALVLLGGAALFFGGDRGLAQLKQPRVVEAERFVLKDALGRERAVLGTDQERVGLRLLDQAGKTRAALDLGGTGLPGVDFFDEKGTRRVVLGVGKADNPFLFLMDGPKGKQVQLSVYKAVPQMALTDSEGRRRVVATVDQEPLLQLLDAGGKAVYTKP
jgi:hypothetical protein